MGNNNSSPFCGECDCGSSSRVITACNTAGGEAGVSRTLEQTITGLLGKENSDFIMDTYTNTLDNETSNDKWV